MKLANLALAAAIFAATPAFASATVATGAKVVGPEGAAVGTVVSVDADTAVVDTGKHRIPLALDGFAEAKKGFSIKVSKDQLDTMVDNQLAEMAAVRDEMLVAGAAVTTADAKPLGTIAAVEGDNVVIARAGNAAKQLTLLRDSFDAGDTGPMARLTLAQVDAAVSVGQ